MIINYCPSSLAREGVPGWAPSDLMGSSGGLRSGAGFKYSDQQVGFAAVLQERGEEGNP